MAGVLLGLVLSLYAAVVLPDLHHFWHSAEDGPCEEQEGPCVVVAFASGTFDPGPIPASLVRPALVPAAIPVVPHFIPPSAFDHARPPGRGPPPLG